MYDKVPFGQWLRQRRKTLDLTQEQLAERIGCSPDMVRKIELGERRPSRQVADLLADLLNIPTKEREAFNVFARGLDDHMRPSEAVWALRPPSNLPAPLISLIGREELTNEATSLLLQYEVRLLTLIGPPGVGKTSFAIYLAAGVRPHFRDGVFFVDLAPVSEPHLVISAIAGVLAVREAGGQLLRNTLLAYVRGKQMLLVLDNFEQVLDASVEVVALLESSPGLNALITSREALHVRGERPFPVPPLRLPDLTQAPNLAALAQNPAVTLFVERAKGTNPGFALTTSNTESVATICVQLDGLPLAIELAAARIRLLSPQEIQARLDNRLKLLTAGSRDLPTRQQTLRSAIDWSYALLKKGEQTLFSRLGVFVGGCTLSAAEAVCSARSNLPFEVLDGIEALLDKSLLKQEEAGGGSRFTMLQMIREYAHECLEESGEEDEIRWLHAEYYLALAEAADLELRGAGQKAWVERLELEYDNLRAALRWYETETEEGDKAAMGGLRLAGALGLFWFMTGRLSEGRFHIARLVARWEKLDRSEGGGAQTIVKAKALSTAARLAQRQGDNISALSLAEESLTIFQAVEFEPGIAFVTNVFASVADDRGDYALARRLYEESLSLYGKHAEKWGMGVSLHGMGHVTSMLGDYALARMFNEQGLAHREEIGDRWGAAFSLQCLSHIAYDQRDYKAARSFVERSLSIRAEYGDRVSMGECLVFLAAAHWAQGRVEQSVRLFGAAQSVYKAIGSKMGPFTLQRFEEGIAATRAQLDEARWEKAWSEGQAMAVEQTIEFALGDA